MNKPERLGTAYSYIRFSSLQQERGDSVRRQTEARDRWLAANPAVKLAAENDYRELGTSSFRGRHRLDDKAALKQFIRAVESGRVKSGSYLIVESFDRLTREEFGEAAEFVLGLVNRGIKIVQLSPVEVVLEKPVDLAKALILVVELTRGHGESKRKSDMIGAAWSKKREACRESGKIVTKWTKAWLEVKDDAFVFKPGAKALIRRIFKLATEGYGCRAIARKLHDENVPPWTRKGWYELYIRNLIHGREVRGEFQQASRGENGKRILEPEPILNYYPEAVTEAEWRAAQVATEERRKKAGRPPKNPNYINVFAGRLFDAKSGDKLHISMRNGKRLLFPESYRRRGINTPSFPLTTFEHEVLTYLKELDVREIQDTEDGPDEVAELAAKLTRLDTQLRRLVDQFDGEDIPEVEEKIRLKHAERKLLAEEHDRKAANAASPLSTALGECRSLVEALSKTKDVRETRLRLRQAVGRIAERITCLLVARGLVRIAAVQINYSNGMSRLYLIYHRYAESGRRNFRLPEASGAISGAIVPKAGKLDLRKPEDVVAMEKVLSKIDEDMFAAPVGKHSERRKPAGRMVNSE